MSAQEVHETVPVLWRNRALAAMEAEEEARTQKQEWEETKREYERGG
jgi:hypothetical protein